MTVFLFTDIEGSAERWEAHPIAMPEALRDHDAIVRAAAESHGGFVFKAVGDAFCIAFAEVPRAVEAAVAAQRDLQRRDWSAIGGLRVRMALHAGEAEERDGDYFGATVNRVARLLSTGHGGQILASGSVSDRLENAPLAGITLRPLGTFRLKDLREPERVALVLASGLADSSKPLRSVESVPNNLPRRASPFVGRGDDIAGVGALLRDGTLVTVVGPGGVGKTRLALECANAALGRASDGVWMADLSTISEPALVASTVLGAVGGAAGAADPTEALLAHLGQREVLLVLDNCEHVIGEAARIVDALHARCPRVTILATSREALRVEGERTYRLEPLGAEDARRLFVQRATAADAAFALATDDEATVDEICRHLDGIPLAIELAAARTRMLPLADIARRLDERFRVLTGGSRSAMPRQQTLRALIEWSYDLLSSEERALYRRLAVFRGAFTLAAVAAVGAADDWEALDLLGALVDKSLVVGRRGDADRYRLLETIRAFGRERLDEAGEADAALERHARYYAGAAPSASVEDLDDLRAALEWSIAERRDPAMGAALAADATPLFIRLSLLAEAAGWCSRALASDGALAPAARGRLEYALSTIHNNQAAYPQALAAAERALPLLRDGDDRVALHALAQVAQQYARAGRYEDARPLADEALRRARELGDPRVLGEVTRRCAFALPPSEIERARAQYEEAAAALEGVDGREERCRLLEWWAESEAAAGCFDRAREIGFRVLAETTSDRVRMHVSSNIAGYALAQGDFETAAPLARESLEMAREAQHPLLIAIALAYVAPARADLDPIEAARLFGYARARMAALQWTGIASDERARENIADLLAARLAPERLAAAFAEGAAWNEREALACAAASSPARRTPDAARSS